MAKTVGTPINNGPPYRAVSDRDTAGCGAQLFVSLLDAVHRRWCIQRQAHGEAETDRFRLPRTVFEWRYSVQQATPPPNKPFRATAVYVGDFHAGTAGLQLV